VSGGEHDRLNALLRRISEAAEKKSVIIETSVVLMHERLTRKIPISIRRLLEEVTPAVWKAAFKHESMRLLDDSEMQWVTADDLADFFIADQKLRCEYFGFAAGIFGDLVCLEVDNGKEGAIALFDHEEGNCIYLAHDLCEWIERLILFEGTDLGYMTGEIDNLEPAQQLEVHRFYQDLNPEQTKQSRQV
jgi:hypothetical protein